MQHNALADALTAALADALATAATTAPTVSRRIAQYAQCLAQIQLERSILFVTLALVYIALLDALKSALVVKVFS